MSNRLITIVGVGVLVLAAAWFFTTFERSTESRYTGFQGIARFNELLAAELLLAELGHETESRASLNASEWLPPEADTIVVQLSVQLGSPLNDTELVTWVRNGGHLVLLPPEEMTVGVSAFLDRFGLELQERGGDDEPVDLDEPLESPDETADDADAYGIDLLRTRYSIRADDENTVSARLVSTNEVLVARRQVDDGFITVVAGQYFDNERLDEYDHGRLLLDVVAGYVTPGKVWLFYSESFPSLWGLLVRNAPYVIVSFVALLIFWLWSVIGRFGPRISDVTHERRSIIEHIDATGAFSWRHRSSEVLWKSAVDELIRAAERSRPGLGRLSAKDQARELAKLTHGEAQDILDAIVMTVEHRPRDFLQRVRYIQAIRNDL